MTMPASAEIRWFWKGEQPPESVAGWFHNGGCEPGGGRRSRRDRYFPHRGEPELGVKIRDEGHEPRQVEIKARIATVPPESLGLDVRIVEIWGKWSTSITPCGDGLVVEKQRWLRKFDAAGDITEIALGDDERPRDRSRPPDLGCNLELTRVVAPKTGELWWTLGFEAFGGLDRVPGSLARTVRALRPPRSDPEAELSYPAWLQRFWGA